MTPPELDAILASEFPEEVHEQVRELCRQVEVEAMRETFNETEHLGPIAVLTWVRKKRALYCRKEAAKEGPKP